MCPSLLVFQYQSKGNLQEPTLQVGFITGTEENSGIAFHFQVYFSKCVVINSHECGGWTCEGEIPQMPFVESQQFDLHILVLHNEYQVMVNDNQCYNFPH